MSTKSLCCVPAAHIFSGLSPWQPQWRKKKADNFWTDAEMMMTDEAASMQKSESAVPDVFHSSIKSNCLAWRLQVTQRGESALSLLQEVKPCGTTRAVNHKKYRDSERELRLFVHCSCVERYLWYLPSYCHLLSLYALINFDGVMNDELHKVKPKAVFFLCIPQLPVSHCRQAGLLFHSPPFSKFYK